MKFILKFLILIIFLSLITSFKCGIDKIKMPKMQKISAENSPNSKLRNLSPREIKIYVDYEILDKNVLNGQLTSSQLSIIKQSMDLTINTIKSFLIVKEPQNFEITKEALEKVSIEEFSVEEVPNLISESKELDYDLFIVAYIDSRNRDFDAAAYPILYDSKTKRPVLGGLILKKNYNFDSNNVVRFLAMLFLHELSHVLAFSNSLFYYFQGITDPTVVKVVNGLPRILLQTPKVLEYARGHFGCPSLTGVELENQGGSGSSGSHWEARIMLGDYMISTDYPELVVSDITLAVFEDSGWYNVNYYTGGLFKTGKGEGCNFLQLTCIDTETKKSRFPIDFCHSTYDEVCTPGMLSRGQCFYRSTISGSFLDQYKYFGNNSVGGFEPTDFCPVAYFSRSCHDDNNFCFQTNLSTSGTIRYFQARCYKVKSCDKNTFTYTVEITNSDSITCSDATSQKTSNLGSYNGVLVCPPYWRICGGENLCNDPFECARAKIKTQMTDTYNYVIDKSVYDPLYDYPDDDSVKFIHFKFLFLISLLNFIF